MPSCILPAIRHPWPGPGILSKCQHMCPQEHCTYPLIRFLVPARNDAVATTVNTHFFCSSLQKYSRYSSHHRCKALNEQMFVKPAWTNIWAFNELFCSFVLLSKRMYTPTKCKLPAIRHPWPGPGTSSQCQHMCPQEHCTDPLIRFLVPARNDNIGAHVKN